MTSKFANQTFFKNAISNREIAFLALFVVIIYLGFPTKNYYWDGIVFAQTIESAKTIDASLIHPNHLVYNVLGWIIYRFAKAFSDIRAVYVLQAISSFFSAAAAVLFFKILQNQLRSLYLSLSLTALLAFSATWWKFSTDADAYLPSIFFLLAAFYFILPDKIARPITVALLHVAAMCLHQLAFLFFPVIVAGLIFQTAAAPIKNRLKIVAQYTATVSATTATAFYFCFVWASGDTDFRAFLRWLTSFSPDIGFVFSFAGNLSYTLRGHLRLFFDGRFNFIDKNPFLIIAAVAVAALFFLLLRRQSNAAVIETSPRRTMILGLVWIAPYLVFLFFFIAQNTFYRLFYLPALLLIGGILFDRTTAKPRRHWRAAGLVSLIALCNFLFFIQPYSKTRDNTPLSLALAMQPNWTAKTNVYYAQTNSDSELIRYFNPATTWKLLATDSIEQLESEFDAVTQRGETMWLETSAVEKAKNLPDGANWLTTHTSTTVELTDPAYKLKIIQLK